jgi:hypothetical protein
VTAASVLTLCVSRGLRLAPAGAGVRVDGPKAVRDELREAIREHKTELLDLLRDGRVAEVSAFYSQAFARLGAMYPDSLIGNLWPSIAREHPTLASAINTAEAASDAAGLAYQNGEAPDSGPFLAALAQWEARWREAIAVVTASTDRCSDCGARAVVLVGVDYDPSLRYCRRCLRPTPLNPPKGARRDA